MLGLRTTVYKVNDLEAAKMWYSKAFEVKPYFDESFYVGFNIKGYELGLLPVEHDILRGEGILSYWGVEDIFKSFDYFRSKTS
jgi:lactoylglutathione lyase